jgi:hypothetical protein
MSTRFWRRAISWGCVVVIPFDVAIVIAVSLWGQPAGASPARTASAIGTPSQSVHVKVAPSTASVHGTAPTLTRAGYAKLLRAHLRHRERVAASEIARAEREAAARTGSSGFGDASPTVVARPVQSLSQPLDKNVRNTVAQSISFVSLPEPAAANASKDIEGTASVFFTGNSLTGAYRSYSTDDGGHWTNAGAFPAGPSDAPNVCCDTDVVYDPVRGVTFYLALYSNATDTNGVIRLFVRGRMNHADSCWYDLRATNAAGTPLSNVTTDFPKLALSNNYLYVTSNDVTNVWINSEVRRLNAAQLAACQSADTRISHASDFGIANQRVFVPVEGATTTMYWGVKDTTSSTFRVFSWPESSTSPSSVVRTVINTNFTKPDCRGGVNNGNYIDDLSASGVGFRTRGAVGGGRLTFFWAAGADATHSQGHLNGASFRTSDLALVESPVIFNNTFCFFGATLGSNSRGELGISLASGGRAGGGGDAARGFVGVDDNATTGIAFTLALAADADYNATIERWGDYVTVRPNRRHSQCQSQWVATSYGLLGGNTSPSHVNARYVEFRSTNDSRCPK